MLSCHPSNALCFDGRAFEVIWAIFQQQNKKWDQLEYTSYQTEWKLIYPIHPLDKVFDLFSV